VLNFETDFVEVTNQPLHFERLRFVVAAMLTAIVAGAPLGSDAQNEQSYHALSMPVVMTNSTNGALIGSFIGGLIGVLIGRRVFRDRYYERELAAENELRRRHRAHLAGDHRGEAALRPGEARLGGDLTAGVAGVHAGA